MTQTKLGAIIYTGNNTDCGVWMFCLSDCSYFQNPADMSNVAPNSLPSHPFWWHTRIYPDNMGQYSVVSIYRHDDDDRKTVEDLTEIQNYLEGVGNWCQDVRGNFATLSLKNIWSSCRFSCNCLNPDRFYCPTLKASLLLRQCVENRKLEMFSFRLSRGEQAWRTQQHDAICYR